MEGMAQMDEEGDFSESSSWSDEEDEKEIKPVTEEELFEMQQKALNSDWLLNVPMVKWNQEQLELWASTLSVSELEKKTIDDSFDGSALLQCSSHEHIMKVMGISENDAKELFEEIQVQKRIEKEQKYASKMRRKAVDYDAQRWKTRAITKWTVKQTVEWIKSLKFGKLEERDIIHKLNECEFDGETITNYLGDNGVMELAKILDVKPSTATIVYHAAQARLKQDMSSILAHGSDEKESDTSKKKKLTPLQTQYRDRSINLEKYPNIVLTKDQDIIMKFDSNDGILIAKMPGCGHGIAAETLYFYIKSSFEKQASQTEIFCPDPQCRAQWDWSYCTRVADMNEEEMKFWNRERDERIAAINFRRCPKCDVMCCKPKDVGTLRVSCRCGVSDWCWICRGKWVSASTRVCGNADCTMIKEINKTLKQAPLFTPMGIKDETFKIPDLRACPVCMTIVHHVDEQDKYGHHCKHVTCPVCKPQVRFCFICLGIYDKGKGWPCGSYKDQCEAADIQEFK